MTKVSNSMGLQEYMETVQRRNMLGRVDNARSLRQERKRPSEEEHSTQAACVAWFRYQYPSMGKLLFAVPNGGARSKSQGGKLKAEGVLRGVADLLLLVPVGKYHGLCIEMKREKGSRWEKEQREWKEEVERQGYKYIICHNQNEFETQVNLYLKGLL